MLESELPASLRNRLVLLIEDDAVLLEHLAGSFTAAGFRVMTAPDGAVGLKKFEQIRPDLVVTDIVMPDREGVETIMAMKARDKSVPILAISGGGRLGPSEFLTLAVGLGADSAMAKPFRSKDILARAAELLTSTSKTA